jgi:hypothetical protein
MLRRVRSEGQSVTKATKLFGVLSTDSQAIDSCFGFTVGCVQIRDP